MRTMRRWLIVKANGDTRVVTRSPAGRLDRDECAVLVELRVPSGWSAVAADPITVQLPEPPTFSTPDGEPILVGYEPGHEGGDDAST